MVFTSEVFTIYGNMEVEGAIIRVVNKKASQTDHPTTG